MTVDYATADGTAIGRPGLRRHPANAADLRPGPDRADRHGDGQRRAASTIVSKTFSVNLSDPMGVTHQRRPGHRHDREPQCPAPGRDRQRDGDRQSRRPDRRDLHRHPVGALRPAGDGGLRHGRRQRHGGLRLRRRPRQHADLRPGPDRADRHRDGQRRAGRRAQEVLHIDLSAPTNATLQIGQATGTIVHSTRVPTSTPGIRTIAFRRRPRSRSPPRR